MGRYSTISVTADVQLSEVFEEIDTLDLIEELKRRKDETAKAAITADDLAFPPISSWDFDCLVAAVRDDDGRRCVDILTPLLAPFHPVQRVAA